MANLLWRFNDTAASAFSRRELDVVDAASGAQEVTGVGGLLPWRRPRDVNGLSLFPLPGEHGHGLGILEEVLCLLYQRL